VLALLASVLLVSRGLWIARSHGMCVDAPGHLYKGDKFLHRALPRDIELNDPPLADAISALPILWTWHIPKAEFNEFDFNTMLPDETLVQVAVFKSLLFVPAVVLVFWWAAEIYGAAAGWLAAGMLLIDPTFAANIPIAPVDAISTEAILFACYAAWKMICAPTRKWQLITGVSIAIAMLMKHTAVILPGVVVAMAVIAWSLRRISPSPGTLGEGGGERSSAHQKSTAIEKRPSHYPSPGVPGEGTRMGFARACRTLAIVFLTAAISLWALTLFDIRRPYMPARWKADPPAWATALTHLKLPAGMYVASFMEAMSHNDEGHPAFLFGQFSKTGWWYYFPAVATVKTPVGFFVIILLGLLSLTVVRPRWAELSLLIPFAAWTSLLMDSHINIGFRHFLTPYLFGLMMSTRCLAARGRLWHVAAWCGLISALINVSTFGPDFLSYVNRDIPAPWRLISDSNLDWGQTSKQAGQWVARNVPPNQPVAYVHFGYVREDWIGSRVTLVDWNKDLPTHGLLILSPNYAIYPRFKWLESADPVAIIGHNTPVYDLDSLASRGEIVWQKPRRPWRDLRP